MRKCLYYSENDVGPVRVWEEKNTRWLTISDSRIQSIINMDMLHQIILPHLNPMLASLQISAKRKKDILILGLGGGAMIHFIRKFYPDDKITVVEIDPTIIHIAKEFFYIGTKRDDIKIIQGDAFSVLNNNPHQYDIIIVDLTVIDIEEHISLHQASYNVLSKEGLCIINSACFNTTDAETVLSSFSAVFKRQCLSIPVKGTQNLISSGWINPENALTIFDLVKEGCLSLESNADTKYGLIASRFSPLLDTE